MKKILFIFLLCSLMFGCTQIKFSIVNAPEATYSGEIIEDLPYGELDRQKLDIYIPDMAKMELDSLPVIVFFHGGRWTDGSKDQYKFVGMTLSELGYVVVLPNTRLYPDVKFPIFAQDAAQALAWVHNNAHLHHGNKNLFISGHSSGAHLGALIIADNKYLAQYSLTPNIVNAFVGLSGPYDFVPKKPDLKDMFGPPENFPKLVVTNYIDGNEPPMLLIYSDGDETVHPRNLRALKEGIAKAHGNVESIIYETGGHVATVSALSWVNPSGLSVKQDMDNYFRRYLLNNSADSL
jgi:acetyl esterase/lipase